MPDFVPGQDDSLLVWLTTLKTKAAGRTAVLGITPARLTQITAWCEDLIAALQTAGTKKNEWLAASSAKQTQLATSLAGLRAEIGLWKKTAGMTPAIAAELQIVSSEAAFDQDSYQTTITTQVFSGYVRIKFTKGQTDGVNIYYRRKGESAWKFLARDTNSPYDDHTPLATAGVPEVREYQAFGVVNDEQIGLPSDIATATFGG